MAGGRKIDDHSFWAGKGGKDHVLPKGVHTKRMSQGGESGHLGDYEDTAEKIESQQEMGHRKAKGHNQKPLHRY